MFRIIHQRHTPIFADDWVLDIVQIMVVLGVGISRFRCIYPLDRRGWGTLGTGNAELFFFYLGNKDFLFCTERVVLGIFVCRLNIISIGRLWSSALSQSIII